MCSYVVLILFLSHEASYDVSFEGGLRMSLQGQHTLRESFQNSNSDVGVGSHV